MDLNNIQTQGDLLQAIAEYCTTPRRPALTGAQLGILLTKVVNLSGAGGTEAGISEEIDSGSPLFVYDPNNMLLTLNWDATLQANFTGLRPPKTQLIIKVGNNSQKEISATFPVFNDDGQKFISTVFENITQDIITGGFKLIISI